MCATASRMANNVHEGNNYSARWPTTVDRTRISLRHRLLTRLRLRLYTRLHTFSPVLKLLLLHVRLKLWLHRVARPPQQQRGAPPGPFGQYDRQYADDSGSVKQCCHPPLVPVITLPTPYFPSSVKNYQLSQVVVSPSLLSPHCFLGGCAQCTGSSLLYCYHPQTRNHPRWKVFKKN